jgi:hypothetical protein
MSIMICIACGDQVDTDLEDFNFDTLQCTECDELDERIPA